MPQINTVDFRSLFTKKLAAVYSDFMKPTQFLASFFTEEESDTKLLSIEVERGYEKVAVDVIRGTEGNKNDFGLSVEKVFEPPYYREWFDATDLDFYDRMFGAKTIDVDARTFNNWVKRVAKKLSVLEAKERRAIELQASQVLQTGVVQLVNGTNIDFKRDAASLVALGAGDRWNEGTSNPISDCEAACNYIRQEGKAADAVFNFTFGSLAWENFINNAVVKERADVRRFDLMSVREPQRNAEGAVLLGRFTCGNYVANAWGYPQFYDDANNVSQPYVDPKNVIVVPERPKFVLGYAAVPMIQRDPRNAEFPEFIRHVQGKFHVGNYIDPVSESHRFDIKTAPLCIPVQVDGIYTMQVLA